MQFESVPSWQYSNLFEREGTITRYKICCPWCKDFNFDIQIPTVNEVSSETRELEEVYGCPKCKGLTKVTFPLTGKHKICIAKKHKYSDFVESTGGA